MAIAMLALLVLLVGPAADALHVSHRTADPSQPWDAVYLVCGARAQQRRLQALTQWMERSTHPPPLIFVGNDSQNSLWSRVHQRNLTRAEWGIVALEDWKAQRYGTMTNAPQIRLIPGSFGNTDSEMQALGNALHRSPEIRRLAIVTSRFHARRSLRRLDTYAPPGCLVAVVPGVPHWEDRAPWIVASEYLKMLRDAFGYTQTPFLSRPPEHHHQRAPGKKEYGLAQQMHSRTLISLNLNDATEHRRDTWMRFSG